MLILNVMQALRQQVLQSKLMLATVADSVRIEQSSTSKQIVCSDTVASVSQASLTSSTGQNSNIKCLRVAICI